MPGGGLQLVGRWLRVLGGGLRVFVVASPADALRKDIPINSRALRRE